MYNLLFYFKCKKKHDVAVTLGWQDSSVFLTVLIPNVSFFEIFESSIKPDINSTENSADPDQLASEEAS